MQFRRTRSFGEAALVESLVNDILEEGDTSGAVSKNESGGSNIGMENPYLLALNDQKCGDHQGPTAKQNSSIDDKTADCIHACDAGDRALLLSERLQAELGSGGEPECDGGTRKALGLPAPLCFVDATV